jgi:peptidyl-prolyl cis-trans isomerase B (cyclophilin B)
VSPNSRDRARAKRRYQKNQSGQARRELAKRRNNQIIAVIVVVFFVMAGMVGLSMAQNQGANTQAIDPTPSAAAAPRTSATPTAVRAQTVAGCTAAPKVPGERKGLLPDKKIAAGKTFVARVTTNCGVITMELNGAKAPQTVASFIGLAKGSYWANSPCHRLTTSVPPSAPLFVLQCGDPTGSGSGNPGYGYGVENAPANFLYPRGTLAMARTTDPKSNGGQFFIVYKDTKLEDRTGYSIFGRVTSGMDILDKIAAAGSTTADNTPPVQPISILKVDVAEKKA